MSTKRDYGRTRLNYNKIIQCYEYKKEPEQAWKKEYADRELTRSIEINDLIHSIPKEVRWLIQEDTEKGALAMANYFNRTILYSYEEIYDCKRPRNGLTNLHLPGGPYESTNYHRGIPQEKIAEPKGNQSNKDGIKIRLVIRPNKHHYLQSAEMNHN